ncbi:hypothetical protein [Pontibacter vulgaris]|uniref:hypothetical protein n=1 Tax=Pontibacter vulgaris TaxID=2905679 RepID=UPI001FA7025B|nr:hypothetical protein [Pontibacter vulgaris]
MASEIMTESFPLNTLNLYPTEISFSGKLHSKYDASKNMLFIEWHGEVSSADVKFGYYKVIEMVKHFKPNRWVLDLRNRESIKREDQLWVIKHIFSQALRLLQCNIFVAIILPVYSFQSLVSELDGDELIYNDNFLIINHYLYIEESLRWLESITEAETETISI